MKVVLDHGDHRVLHILLVLAQLRGHLLHTTTLSIKISTQYLHDIYLLKLLGEGLDDHVAVCDLLAVELDEGQHPLLGAVLAFVVHILKQASVRSEQSSVECNMYCARAVVLCLPVF